MKIVEEIRTVKVSVVELEGERIDYEVIYKFLDEAASFEDTIGKKGNYTNSYIYFQTKEEEEIEPILLKLNVIALPEKYKEWNDKVESENSGYYKYKKYWLGKGYKKFYKDFWKETNKIKE